MKNPPWSADEIRTASDTSLSVAEVALKTGRAKSAARQKRSLLGITVQSERLCVTCGMSFVAVRTKQVTCSRACRRKFDAKCAEESITTRTVAWSPEIDELLLARPKGFPRVRIAQILGRSLSAVNQRIFRLNQQMHKEKTLKTWARRDSEQLAELAAAIHNGQDPKRLALEHGFKGPKGMYSTLRAKGYRFAQTGRGGKRPNAGRKKQS